MSIFSFEEIINKKEINKYFFVSTTLVLCFVLCFRYGQGTDYREYYNQYSMVSITGNIFDNILAHGELGWYILMFSFKKLGISFDVFIIVISLFVILFSTKAIYKYSPYKITSLLILYPTYYLTYFFSGIRQGIVVATFLGINLPLLCKRKIKLYYIVTLILMFIHKSAFILLVIPFISKIRIKRKNLFLPLFILLSLLFSLIIKNTSLFDRIALYFDAQQYITGEYSYLAIIFRFILYVIIYFLKKDIIYENNNENRIIDMFFTIYTFGYILYNFLSFSSIISQRITMPLKSIEILLIPLLFKMKNYKDESVSRKGIYINIGKNSVLLSAIIVVLLSNVELVKNIDSYIKQGNYYSNVNVFNYPYISIFNKDSIHEYRYYNVVK